MGEFEQAEGWLYLVVVIDAFSRMVVGWAMGDRPTTELVLRSVTMAVRNRRPPVGLVHHSDHGSQYTSLAFGQHLLNAGITGSMGTVGDALDNAVAESFFATCRPSFWIASPGQPEQDSRPPSSSSSRAFITGSAAIPHSGISARLTLNRSGTSKAKVKRPIDY